MFDDAPLSFAPQRRAPQGTGSALDGATWGGSVRNYLPDASDGAARDGGDDDPEDDESESRSAAIEAAVRAQALAMSGDDAGCWGAQQTMKLHPRSLQLLSPIGLDMQSGGGTAGAMRHEIDASRRVSSSGETMYAEDTAARDAAEDAFRAELEHCDSLRGVQVLCDVDGAFGGWGALFVRYIRDECPGATVLCIPTETAAASAQRELNVALSTALLTQSADIVVPFSAAALWGSATGGGGAALGERRPLWDCRLRGCLRSTTTEYAHASLSDGASAETLAAALDTLSSPWRVRSSGGAADGTMGAVLNALRARPAAKVSCSFMMHHCALRANPP